MGINLYFSMLKREYELYRNFKRVETHTIDTLDRIVNQVCKAHAREREG